MGLLHLAMSTGSIEWGQSKLVYANDSYENLGIDQAPSHKYNAFGTRGDLVGAYCVVRTSTGAYLTEEMSREQLEAVKARSESGKQNKGPWFTDFEEMCRKTVVKRAAKMWPKVNRLDDAIQYLNTDGGEGITKDEPVRDVTPISLDSEAWLTDHYNALDDDKKPKMLAWLKVNAICDLTEQQAQAAIKALKAKK
jgi:recombination protein RecT